MHFSATKALNSSLITWSFMLFSSTSLQSSEHEFPILCSTNEPNYLSKNLLMSSLDNKKKML